MNLFLEELVGRDRDAGLQAHPKNLAARQLPHESLAVVPRAFGLRKPPQFDLFGLDLEGDDRVVALLDHNSFYHQFDGREPLGAVRVFTVPNAKEVLAMNPGELDRSTLAWRDLLRNAPAIEALGICIQAVEGHDGLLWGLTFEFTGSPKASRVQRGVRRRRDFAELWHFPTLQRECAYDG